MSGWILPPVVDVGPIEAWRTRGDWRGALAAALETPEAETIRRIPKSRAAKRTILAVADLDAAAADDATGRRSALSATTIAKQLGVTIRTVGRARAALEALGASITVAGGRYLRADERAATGRLRAASTRVLTYPHGFRRGARMRPPSKMSINVVKPRERRISRSSIHPKRDRIPDPHRFQTAELVRRMPWLARDVHIGAVSAILRRSGVPPTVPASEILGAIEARNRRMALTVPDPAAQRNPRGLFAAMLADVAPDLAAPRPPRRDPAPAKLCPPHDFDPVSGWCVKGCGLRDDGRRSKTR